MGGNVRILDVRCRCGSLLAQATRDDSDPWEIATVTRSGRPRRYGGQYVPADDDPETLRYVEGTGTMHRTMLRRPGVRTSAREFRCPRCKRVVVVNVKRIKADLDRAARSDLGEVRV
jgi:hypothetical protein